MIKSMQLYCALHKFGLWRLDFYEKLSPFVSFKCYGRTDRLYLSTHDKDYTYLIGSGEIEVHVSISPGKHRLQRIYGPGSALCRILEHLPPGSYLRPRDRVKFFRLHKDQEDLVLATLPNMKNLLESLEAAMAETDKEWESLRQLHCREWKPQVEKLYPNRRFKDTEIINLFNIAPRTYYRMISGK